MLIKNKEEKHMGMLARALGDHLKEVAWALFLILLILACLYLIFGRHLGYETTIWICLGFALIVIGLFMMIILGELLWLGILKVFKYFKPED
jgi:fatty acid desaturase